ncbi:hypothetical protein GGQ08_001832 [Salinibacter ruber]|uniref:sulfotransferase family protein n=1 Tax=Salinibacter ruber TaxID=146919 RepID=UPI0013AF2C8E|nr:sulfotransferase [Salinibacter ruber]MBB4060903.1 hypothetical protein [Salinibacter ruber]MCS3641015.1 hypothetical protein [Salinibacter ruber]MCS3650540.1 hypothetical protein [Salinibacter ruber]MCS3653792.1 hypothetical protein [Salinibacter ruber]MCS3821621.1 hypothetical protein [Salinibacter ruber]
MLPTFLVIGAMKCGTTSLYYYLAEHPEIGMSHRKETDFFLATHGAWDRGRDWYTRQFPTEVPERGECAPNYTKRHLFDDVPTRIESICPDVKLIYLVRDPIERTISHYRGSRRDGREQRSFEAAVADVDTSNYVLTSRYHFQLQPYLEQFSGEDLLVVTAEELDSAPTSTLRTIYRFLDVNPAFENQRVGRRFNDSVGKKKLAPWTRWLSRQVPQSLKDRTRPYLPLHWLPGERIPRPEVSPETRARLEAVFRPDVEALRDLTGRDFSAWSV